MAKSFELQMKEFENMTAEKSEKLFRKVCFDLSRSIIKDVPVDTARAKGSFFPEIDSISTQVNGENDTDKTGNKSIAKVKSKTNGLKIGSYFSLTSNLDYITTLEFGLYPNPVKNGTPYQIADRDGFITETGFVKLSENGFSKKAPAGFVGINIMRFQNFVNQANKDIK